MSVFTYCAARISIGVLGELSLTRYNSRVCKFFTSSSARYCKHNEDFDANKFEKNKVRKKSENPKEFRDKNELQASASSTKKKFTVRNNAESTGSESAETNSSNNNLKDSKKPKDNSKKFRIKEVISDHDLQIKIKAMLKHIEKGEKVHCEILGKDKLEEIFTKLNNSDLKSHLAKIFKHPQKFNITFEKKETEEGNVEVKEKEVNKTS